MALNNTAKKSTRHRLPIMIVSFVVALVVLFFAVATAKQYNDFKPYKAMATELNETLGGGYKISYTWRCGLESSNCPSVRMIKDVNFKDNDEAKALVARYENSLKGVGYEVKEHGVCEPWGGDSVYCSIMLKKEAKIVTVLAKRDFIGIDITP